MDNKLRTSLVAAAVSSVLTGTAFAATHSNSTDNTLPIYDYNVSQQAKSTAKATNFKLAKGFKATENLSKGIQRRFSQDHFDSMLNVNTFTWATEADKVSNVAVSVLDRKTAIEQAAKQFSTAVGKKHGVTSVAMQHADLVNVHDLGRGAVVAKYQQKVNGLDVFERNFNVVMNQDMQLVATTGYFSDVSAPRKPLAAQFELAADQAISKAFTDMTGATIQLTDAGERAKFKEFDGQSENYNLSTKPRAKMVYYAGIKRLIPAYLIEIMASNKANRELSAYRYVVSAESGEILRRFSFKQNDAFTYKVFADASAPHIPYDSPMGTALTPHPTGVYDEVIAETQQDMNDLTIENSGLISTNDPWLPAGATETTGNNVDAYADITAPDGFNEGDLRADVTSAGTFDYQYDVAGAVNSEINMKAAIVNLFYTANHLHDTYYDHGFNEAAGTGQMDNYDRGGEAGDPLHVEGLDNGGLNNANMSTPLDGGSPRMQMYLWTAQSSSMTAGALSDLTYQVSGSFGASEFNLEGNLVRYQDGVSDEGCNAATNSAELAGKVAILSRGSCGFVVKAKNAQDAGAVGVIVVNNAVDAPDDVINMGGTDSSITIPAAMVSYNSGQAIYAEMDAGRDSIQMSNTTLYRDGTVDNAIVAHEWGHYLSHRLSGGGMYANSQGRSMGEGWGDFIALMMMVREEDKTAFNNDHWQGVYNDGGFAIAHGNTPNAYYFGLRRAPYSTDMTYNALTFKHIQGMVELPDTHPISGGSATMAGGYNAEVHAAGEIWANALWEAYASLLNIDGMSFTDAQSKMRDYIVAGMKMTPALPTYTEARDAILAAAIADNFDNYTAMRNAFTKRGMGSAAVSPDRNDPGWDGTAQSHGHDGVVEDFEDNANAVELVDAMLDNAYISTNGAYCDLDDILDAGETAAIKFTMRNAGVMSLAGIKAKITSDADVTFANDGMVEFTEMPHWNDMVSGLVEVKLNSAAVNSDIEFNIEFMSDDETVTLPHAITTSVKVNRDIVKSAARTAEDFEIEDTVFSDWSQHKVGPANSGNYAGIDDWTILPAEVTGFPSTTIMGPDGRVQTDLVLTSPKVMVGDSGEFAMNFNHYYQFESSPAVAGGDNVNWDGAVLEVKIDDGEWQDVVAAGGTFAGTGYNGVVNPGGEGYGPNPVLGGRDGFIHYTESLWLEPESIVFADGAVNGKEVQFRFRIGTDGSVGDWGWSLDDVSFTNNTNATFSVVAPHSGACLNRAPLLSSEPMTTVQATGNVATDIELSVDVMDFDANSTFTYAWSQLSGPTVELSDASAAKPTFTAPFITEDSTLTFNVEVSDGTASSNTTVTVNLLDVNWAPVITSIPATMRVKQKGQVTIAVEASDADGDDLTYSWSVNDGDPISSDSTFVFVAPAVALDQSFDITATVSDGQVSTSSVVKVQVAKEESNSGGSMGGLLGLLLAPLAFIRRRKFK